MFEIAAQLRLNHQKLYNPPEGLMINEINKAWQELEQEEHICEVEIREELIRQQGESTSIVRDILPSRG